MPVTVHPAPANGTSAARTVPYGPAVDWLSNLRFGADSQVMLGIGDSTMESANMWYRKLASRLVPDAPSHASVVYALYNDDADDGYRPAELLAGGNGTGQVVLSDTFDRADGAAGRAESDTGNDLQLWSAGTITGDKFVTTGSEIAKNNTFARDVHATVRITVGSSNSFIWRWHATAAGDSMAVQITPTALRLVHYVAGTATIVVAVNSLPLVAGNTYTLVCWSAGPIFHAEIVGVAGAVVDWKLTMAALATTSPTDTTVGIQAVGGWAVDDLVVRRNPTNIILNGASGGTAPNWAYDPVRWPKISVLEPHLVLIGHGHNFMTSDLTTEYNTLINDTILVSFPDVPIALSTQNPETDNRGIGERWHIQGHALRQAEIRRYARKGRFGLIDAAARFEAEDINGTLGDDGGGTHPTSAGADLWADEARHLFGAA